MFQINCLNPISKVGLDRLTADYKVTDNMNDAEGVLVRSASSMRWICRKTCWQ